MNDVDMHVDDMESCASGLSTSRHEYKIEMFAKEVSEEGAPLKESLLEALPAQSQAMNVLSDDYLRTIDGWWSSVSL